MLFKITVLSIFLTLIYLSGCRYPSDFQKLSELPRDRQAETLKHLPIDRQTDFELEAQRAEPADTSIAQTIASEGDGIIPDVLRRFKNEAKDYKKVDLLQIFSQLCVRGRCARASGTD